MFKIKGREMFEKMVLLPFWNIMQPVAVMFMENSD